MSRLLEYISFIMSAFKGRVAGSNAEGVEEIIDDNDSLVIGSRVMFGAAEPTSGLGPWECVIRLSGSQLQHRGSDLSWEGRKKEN